MRAAETGIHPRAAELDSFLELATRELAAARSRCEQLTAELEEAWRVAEDVALEADRANVTRSEAAGFPPR